MSKPKSIQTVNVNLTFKSGLDTHAPEFRAFVDAAEALAKISRAQRVADVEGQGEMDPSNIPAGAVIDDPTGAKNISGNDPPLYRYSDGTEYNKDW